MFSNDADLSGMTDARIKVTKALESAYIGVSESGDKTVETSNQFVLYPL